MSNYVKKFSEYLQIQFFYKIDKFKNKNNTSSQYYNL